MAAIPSDLAAEYYKWMRDHFDLLQRGVLLRGRYEELGLPVPPDLLPPVTSEGPSPSVPLAPASPPAQPAPPLRALASAPVPVARPPYPVPPSVQPGWISLPSGDAVVMTLVQAILFAEGAPARIRVLRERFLARGVDISEEQINSVGTRLRRREFIEFRENGWELADRDNAPREIAGRIWAPWQRFTRQEIAAHRRESLLSILRDHGPLTRSGMLVLLKQAEWVDRSVPIGDLLNNDLKTLAKLNGAVRRNPLSGLWSVEEPKVQTQLRLAT